MAFVMLCVLCYAMRPPGLHSGGMSMLVLSKASFLELIVGSVEHILVQGVQKKLSLV